MATVVATHDQIGGFLSMTIEELEATLLADPFNLPHRITYANQLLEDARTDEAQTQFEIVLKQDTENASPWVGLARCQLAFGEDKQALQTYTKAKNMHGFEPVPELDALVSVAQSSSARLKAVASDNNVVQLTRPTEDKVMFADVAGMTALKKTLRLQIIEPFRNPGLFQRFRKKAGGGVLLYGPPGCGKTLIARAIAGECNAEFRSIGISDVLNMWIGESERNLSLIFEQARARKPCVLFFDELDALAYSRSKSSSSSARTVVNEFLSQLDGFDKNNEEVLVLAATNMPWDVDSAMKRPGRFSRQVFVPPPDKEAREEMFKVKMAEVPHGSIDFGAIATRADFFSGADIDGLIDLAKEAVLAEIIDSGRERDMTLDDFAQALDALHPSTLDWLSTARNLVKFAGSDNSYKEVEKYLRKVKKF